MSFGGNRSDSSEIVRWVRKNNPCFATTTTPAHSQISKIHFENWIAWLRTPNDLIAEYSEKCKRNTKSRGRRFALYLNIEVLQKNLHTLVRRIWSPNFPIDCESQHVRRGPRIGNYLKWECNKRNKLPSNVLCTLPTLLPPKRLYRCAARHTISRGHCRERLI